MSHAYNSLEFTDAELAAFRAQPTLYFSRYSPRLSGADKAKDAKLDVFTIEPLVNTATYIGNCIESYQKPLINAIDCFHLAFEFPIAIINLIIEMQIELSEAQLYILKRAKLIKKYASRIHFISDEIANEIALYAGSYCWDGEFQHIYVNASDEKYLLHNYSHMNRSVFYCGNRDVVYCKSDEFCFGSRYFVNILIDTKNDEMWLGIIFDDLERWSSYSQEYNQIAYYGARLSTTQYLVGTFTRLFPEISEKCLEKVENNEESKIKENVMRMIDVEDESSGVDSVDEAARVVGKLAGERNVEYEETIVNMAGAIRIENSVDMGMGNIQGRSKILSDLLPWYGTGDIVSILVDTEIGMVYFFKNGCLVWYVKDKAIKYRNVKVFGCTDYSRDALVYERVLWNDEREEDLQAQMKRLEKAHPNVIVA